ncbi:hypothetical protein H105_08305 [Trichophyton soudanense CBS 452.61]|uniref:Uncharacterized protein n=1 Tax=Trichophyton soudanense CBS 452.61 TaxID=1215331 RepID=A0A022XFS5_TRISD|nr:hypothetical protein H105_08305 [Trichophyton soudanense CBS 452.61]
MSLCKRLLGYFEDAMHAWYWPEDLASLTHLTIESIIFPRDWFSLLVCGCGSVPSQLNLHGGAQLMQGKPIRNAWKGDRNPMSLDLGERAIGQTLGSDAAAKRQTEH